MIRRVLKIFFVACLILIAGLIIFNIIIQKKISKQLTNLSPAFQVRFASFHTNFFSSSVSFDSLQVNFIPYNNRQQNKHSFYFSRASLKGISFLKFLFNKKLVADNFQLEEGNIQSDQFLLDKKDSAQAQIFKEIKWPFKKLFINSVELKRAKLFLHTDRDDQLIAKGDVAVGRISVNKPGGDPAFSSIDLRLSDLNYPLPGYGIQIRQLAINSGKKILEMDYLHFISGKQKYNEVHISFIKITGFDVMKLFDEQILTAGNITLGESKFTISGNEKLKTGALPFNLKKIHADIFQCKTASVSYEDKKNKCNFNAAINIHKLNISDPFVKDDIHFASLRGSLSGIHYTGNSHNIEIKNAELNSEKEMIEIENLKIIPRFGKYEFGRRLGRQADRVEASIPKIEILRPDMARLPAQKLIAEKIKIGESRVYIFRDRRLPRQQKIIPLPSDYLKTLPLDIRVKTFELASSTVAYEEYPKKGYGQTGILRIEKIRATLSPLINHPLPSDPAYITMNVEGSIMGSGTAHGTIVMPFQKNKPYHIKGIFERLDLTKLNSSSENLGKIRIKSGYLDFLFFDFTMTEQRSTGKIIGAYHRLIIQPFKKHTEEKNVADFASFMLRRLIIPLNKDRSLPERKRTGLVNYQRDPTRMVSQYFLQSLLMGVKKSFTLGFLLPK